jgi:hypothetical protein
MSISTDNIFRENELDKGFVLRANDQVTRILREMISHSTAEENSEKNLNIISLDSNKRTYG